MPYTHMPLVSSFNVDTVPWQVHEPAGHFEYEMILVTEGSVTATIGLITPSVIIIMVIAYFLKKFRESRLVDAALYGLRPASVALISAAGVDIVLFALLQVDSIYEIAKASISWKSVLLAALIYVGTNFVPKLKKIHPIWFIAASAVIGVVLQMG